MHIRYDNFSYAILILTLSFLIFATWFWIYKIKPYLINLKIKKQLQQHSEWRRLEETEQFLIQLYKKTNPYQTSRKECKRMAIKSNEFVYGEISWLSFFTILDKVNPQPYETFYDLGCGSGKAVFTAALFFDLSKACGVELLPALHTLANEQIDKAKSLIKLFDTDFYKSYTKRITQIQFLNENFIDTKLSDADIVFINATCLKPETWQTVINKLLQLQSGSRVIVNTKRIEHEKFTLIHQAKELMSWGMSTISIYKVT